MGNTEGILGKWKVLLKLNYEKTLSLSDVLYVPSLRKNLVSESLLNRVGFKIVLEADKVVLIKNNDFVGKGYLTDGPFVLNIINIASKLNEIVLSSDYIVESINLWHGRLGRVNVASIKKTLEH